MDYNFMLNGRSAVITAGATGIGLETALLFANHGANIAVVDTESNIEAAKPRFADLRSFAAFFPSDLEKAGDKEISALCETILKTIPGIDVLANASGCYSPGELEKLDSGCFEKSLTTGLLSAVRFTKHLVPNMLRKRRGNIICFAPDVTGANTSNAIAVAAAAGAIYSFVRNATIDYIRYQVKVHCVQYALPGIQLNRPVLGEPEAIDAANMALWYACGLSRFVIGETLAVSGGLYHYDEAVK